MVFLELFNEVDDNNDARIIVEVGFFQNTTCASLRYHFHDKYDLITMDAELLKELMEVAESNVKGIFYFDKMYNYDCEATIKENILIRKCCCDDESDNPYVVEFPKVKVYCDDGFYCDECYQKYI